MAQFAGLDVLVIGGGNSGVELIERLVTAGAGTVWLSARSPLNLLPREVAGLPLHPVAAFTSRLPATWTDTTARLIQRFTEPDPTHFGLANPTIGPFRHLGEIGVTWRSIPRSANCLKREPRVRLVREDVHVHP